MKRTSPTRTEAARRKTFNSRTSTGSLAASRRLRPARDFTQPLPRRRRRDRLIDSLWLSQTIRGVGGAGVRPVLMPYTCAERSSRALPSRGCRGARVGAEKMDGFVRRDARSRRSVAWSRSRGPSGSARAVPGARRTSPASRAFGRFSRQQARSGPAPRTPGVRARWPAPAPGRLRCRPSMISSDFELDRCVTSA